MLEIAADRVKGELCDDGQITTGICSSSGLA